MLGPRFDDGHASRMEVEDAPGAVMAPQFGPAQLPFAYGGYEREAPPRAWGAGVAQN